MLKRLEANIFHLITFILLAFVSWRILLYGFGQVLSFSFWLDDWPLIWGVGKQETILFNPAEADFHFEQERFAVREGYLQVWSAAALHKFFGLNPYWYHLYGFIAKLTSVLALAWAGWKLTGRLGLGILAGILFSAVFMGSESLYWFNVNAIYLLLALFLITLPFFIKGVEGDRKNFVVSLILVVLSILLYSPRAHILLALPAVVIIWHKELINRKLFVKILVVMAVIFFSFKLFFAEAGTGQVSRAIFHRLSVFSKSGLEEGKRMFLTYPFLPIVMSIFPDKFINLLANFPKSESVILGISVTHFRIWNFLIFPLAWLFLVLGLGKISDRSGIKKQALWIFAGFTWVLFNGYLRKTVFSASDWDWKTHFMFIFSGFLIIFSLFVFHLLRTNKKWGVFAKTLLVSIIFIFVSYFFNWAFDPLIPPGSPNILRYMTIPTAFGALFLSTTFVWAYSLVSDGNIKIPLLTKTAGKIVIGALVFYATFWIVTTNLERARSFVGTSLYPARSHENVSNIMNKVSQDVEFGYPPPIILLDSWDYGEVFAIFIYSGHSLALWNNISNTEEFPLLYYDEEKLKEEFDRLCQKYPIDEQKIYRFKIEKDKAINVSEKLPKLSCQTL